MIYCYKCDSCASLHEEDHRIGHQPEQIDCPACNSQCFRSYADEGDKVPDAIISNSNQYPYVSQRLPRNLDGCPTDKKGKPVIMNKRHEANVMAKHGYTRE